jgi:DNA-binding GntR family transcriptional regulator
VPGIIENDGISVQVYEQIRLMIENGDIAPGEIINRKAIEEILEVSQTPINSALNRLVGEQILAMERRKGYVVRVLGCRELIEIFGLRAGVESVAARIACESITEENVDELASLFAPFAVPVAAEREHEYIHADNSFHRRLVELSGNSMLRASFERYGIMLRSNLQGLIRPPDATLNEHQRIIAAFRRRDAEMVQMEVSSHILKSRSRLIESCK